MSGGKIIGISRRAGSDQALLHVEGEGTSVAVRVREGGYVRPLTLDEQVKWDDAGLWRAGLGATTFPITQGPH